MSGLVTASLLGAGGVAAGILGTSGGITSLIAYPVLLAAGIPPFAANLTNSIALLGSGASSTVRSGRELRGHATTLRRWLPGTVVMSLLGAVLLVTTPPGVFDDVVPLLVAAGAVVLLVQPRIAGRLAREQQQLGAVPVTAIAAAIALYNGYFGAGAGILTIALVMLTAEPVLSRANAVKNALLFVADLAPAVLFAIVGPVVWSAVLSLGAGSLVGGLIGPTIARHAPQDALRVVIGMLGLALAGYLLVT